MNQLNVKTYREAFNYKDKLIDEFKKNKWEKIGSGEVSSVYYSPSQPDKIIKKTNICGIRSFSRCNSILSGGLIYTKNVDKNRVKFMPDYLIEIAVLNSIKRNKSKLTGVPNVDYFTIDESIPEKTLYLKMSKQNPITFTKDPISLILKCMINLKFLQDTLQFTHYDLQWGNVMIGNEGGPVSVKVSSKYYNNDGKDWPVIVDYGTCVFTKKTGSRKIQYVNTLNNDTDQFMWSVFNQYFDGLTLLKSLELWRWKSTGDNISIFEKFPKLVSCFIKSPNPQKYFYNTSYKSYIPKIQEINNDPQGLYTPLEVIQNIIVKFDIPLSVDSSTGRVMDATLPTNTQLVATKQQIKDFNILRDKKYYLHYKENKPEENVEVDITEVIRFYSTKIFSFSLFCADKYKKPIFEYIKNPSFKFEILKGTKDDPGAFYRNYLIKQINKSFDLINNEGIEAGTPGAGLNQWYDFGCLISVDYWSLRMPMMIEHEGVMKPWNRYTKTYMNLDRMKILELAKQKGVDEMLHETNWGTVEDYITYRYRSELSPERRQRFGLYNYKLPEKFWINNVITEAPDLSPVYNTEGFIGTLVRFLPFQDPKFDTVLIRDAHSSMPNKNFTYDRDWYNTWITKTTKKLWMYHGLFYNPPHASGLKIPFAATWGGRSQTRGEPILSLKDHTLIFSFYSYNPEYYYQKTGYGIDERIMYRLTELPIFMDNTYFVGTGHISYLIYGQENPREYSPLYTNYEGEPTPGELDEKKDPQLIESNNRKLLCRDMNFFLPSYSFFTDMRCVFLSSITKFSDMIGVPENQITLGQYYNALEKYMRRTNNESPTFESSLLRMLPTRYNIWMYLFDNPPANSPQDLNNMNMHEYIKGIYTPSKLNLNNACKVNELFWTGNMFNFDRVVFGDKNLPDKIVVPKNFPNQKV